jgi:membrane AbrB-like protein
MPLGTAAVDACVTLLIGAVGGAVFYLIGAPLPWMLGSLAAVALVAVAGGRWLVPAPVREVARPVVGILAGSAFTPEVVASIGEWWGAIVFVAIYSLVVSALGWLFFRKLCRLDPVTAYFASAPGGLGELTLLGGALGGSMRALVTIHAVRIVAVVFSVPFFLQWLLGSDLQGAMLPAQGTQDAALLDWLILIACGVAGFLAAKLVRMRGGAMIMAMLFSAGVHGTGLTEILPPNWLVALVQVVIGAVAGARFAGIRWLELRNTVLQAAVWACVLLATAVGAAALGAMLFARPFAAMVLAVAPGGMAEMTIMAYALGIEAAFVVTSQVCRLFFVLTLAPLLFRLLGIAAAPAPATPALPAQDRPKLAPPDDPRPD